MLCKKCGAENTNEAKVCMGCGELLNVENSQDLVIPPQKKSLPKKALIGACAAVVALIVIIFIAVNAGTTINLNKYLTIEANGYDGFGTARAIIDWTAIEEKYGDKLSFNSKAKNELGGFLNLMTPMDVLKECINVKFEKSDGLSNGDTIAWEWDIDEEFSNYMKCKVKHKDSSYSVSELEEVGKFNAFSDLEVVFSGVAPNGSVNFNYTGSELSEYYFSCDMMNGLRNGDVIKISIKGSDTDIAYYAQTLGMIPEVLEMDYEVKGLVENVETYADMPDDFIDKLKTEAEDSIYSYTASSYKSNVSLSDLAYSGYVLNVAKDENAYINSYNNMYLIYSGTVSSSEGSFTASTVYYPVRFSNIVRGEDGLSYGYNDGIVGHSSLDGTWYSTNGYTNPLTCYMEIVEANRDVYRAECGDGFEKYAEYEAIAGLNDISNAYKEELYTDAKDRIESYIATTYDESSQATDLQFKGEYLLLAKTQGTDFSNNNRYIVVYSATVSNSKGKFDTTNVYFPVEYDGIVRLPDDAYMTTAVKGIIGSSYIPNSYYNTKGFVDGIKMYTDIVTSNRDKYTYDISEGLKEFGE